MSPCSGEFGLCRFFFILKKTQKKRENKRAKRRLRDTGVYVYLGRRRMGKLKRPGSMEVVFPI